MKHLWSRLREVCIACGSTRHEIVERNVEQQCPAWFDGVPESAPITHREEALNAQREEARDG